MASPLGCTVIWEKQDGVKCIAQSGSGAGREMGDEYIHTHAQLHFFFFKGKTKKRTKHKNNPEGEKWGHGKRDRNRNWISLNITSSVELALHYCRYLH